MFTAKLVVAVSDIKIHDSINTRVVINYSGLV